MIGLSFDKKPVWWRPSPIKIFVEKKGTTFPIFIAKDTVEISYAYNISAIPTIIYFYNIGKIGETRKHVEKGYSSPERIEEVLLSVLEGSAIPPKKDLTTQ